MADTKIEFRKIRDFSENVNDTFQFLRVNFKPLLKSFFAICAIFMLAQSILQGLAQSRYSAIWSSLFNRRYSGNVATSQVFGFQYVLMLIIPLFTYAAMQVAIGAYIKSYVQNDGKTPGIEDVWEIFKKYFFKILLFSLPMWCTVILGVFLCLIPGIYLWVVLVPFVMVVMMEDTGFIATYQRCFDLIKDNFWMSFGIYIVVFIIYYITSVLIGLMVSGIFGVGNYLTTRDLVSTIGIVTAFFSIFSTSFYIIFMISTAFHYFTLAEMKDGEGLLNRISDLGSKKNDFDNIEEQY